MKDKYKVAIGVIAIATILFGSVCLSCYLRGERVKVQWNEYDLSCAVNMIIEGETDKLGDYPLEELKAEAEELLISKNNEEVIKAKYFLAYIETKDKNIYKAIEYLEGARANFKRSTHNYLKISTNFKLSCLYLTMDNYKNSEIAFNNSIEIASKNNNNKALVNLYKYRAKRCVYIPDGVNIALDLIDKAVDIARETEYDLPDVYATAGNVYSAAGQSMQAIQYQLEAIKFAQEEEELDIEISTSIDMAINYINIENYEEAIKYLTSILGGISPDDAELKCYTLINLCTAYIENDEVKKAQYTLNLLKDEIENISDKIKEDTITYMYMLSGRVAIKDKSLLQAIEYLDIAKSRYENMTDVFLYKDFDINLEYQYGNAYYAMEYYRQALEYHLNAEKMSEARGIKRFESKHTEKIYLDYLAIGDYENAIKYMQSNIEIKDKLKLDKDSQYSEYLHKQFESDKKQAKIHELSENKRRMRIMMLLSIIVTSIIISMYGYILRKNREVNKLNKLFKKLSLTDGLTGIPNRRALDEFLVENWVLYRKNEIPISFVMIDIDYFKLYNDNYGHPEGDKVLEIISKEIKSSCRKTDFVARYGGEEFIIIMPNTNNDDATRVVERIRNNVYNRNIKHNHSKISDRITLSIGITTAYISSDKDYDVYIEKSDKALYLAKNSGKNKYVYLE